MTKSKITIVGAGAVGSATAFALAQSGLVREIILQDINKARAEAEALDIAHGSLFFPATSIRGTDNAEDAADSRVVVITAGARQKPGQSRIDLAGDTIKIMESLLPPLLSAAPDAIFLIVANPVDIITFVASEIAKKNGLSDISKVFGSGTNLDTSRLRTLLAAKTGVNPKNIHAYIAGEHGDSEIPLWSSATIGNQALLDFKELPGHPALSESLRNEIHAEVIGAAGKVIEGKGATNYAIALSTLDILTAIIRDERRIMPISTRVECIEGVPNVCLSLPCIVGKEGYFQLHTSLSRDEKIGLQESAEVLRATIEKFGY